MLCKVSDKPLVSVLMANYNNGKYLMDAVNSIRKQTYDNWEIVLVDDGSTDKSKELYRELEKDKRVHIYYNDQNRGCGYTKARCAELANGEICGFLDPDDALLESALEKHVKVHVTHPEVSVIYSRTYLCDADYNILSESKLPDFKKGETYFDYRNWGIMNLATYKNEFYKKTSGINPQLKAGVDQDLYFKIEEVGEIYPLNEFCYYYVTKGRENSISTDFNNFVNLKYWNMEARRDTCIRRGLDVNAVMLEDWKQIFDWYTKCYVRANNDEYIEKIISSHKRDLETIRTSFAFRIGETILKPVKWFIRIFCPTSSEHYRGEVGGTSGES